MAGTDRAYVRPTTLCRRSQCNEDGFYGFSDCWTRAYHQAVAIIQAPDAAGSAAIHEANAMLSQQCTATLTVFVVGIAAINNDVTLIQHWDEFQNLVFCRCAAWQHEPYNALTRELADSICN